MSRDEAGKIASSLFCYATSYLRMKYTVVFQTGISL